MRLTRKTGGAKLGEGSKGIVYDINSPDGELSFYSIIKSRADEIDKIILYSPDGRRLLGKKDIQPFINYIKTTRNAIAKFIKTNNTKKQTVKISHFKIRIDDEVRSNMKIIQKFGKYAKKYLTIYPNLIFKDISFIACKIYYNSNKSPDYVIFGDKCGLIKKVNIDQLIVDIMECLKFTENKTILHNDIKSDNIMYCNGRYKLIDWGNATFGNSMRGGTFMGPLKKYIAGYSLKESKEDIVVKVAKFYPYLYKSAVFKDINSKILAEFESLIENNDKQSLKNNYKGNDDLFSLGFTILETVFREKLDYDKYKELIALMTSYVKPVSAAQALDFIVNIKGY